MGDLLENDPGNRCAGCGPANAQGLRLAFTRGPEFVTASFTPSGFHEGWPGRTHSAFLYLALIETANWTLYAEHGRVGLPSETSALGLKRWVATGEALTLRGRVTDHDGARARVETEAWGADGAVVATLSRTFALPGRAEFLKRMGYGDVPAGLEDVLPE